MKNLMIVLVGTPFTGKTTLRTYLNRGGEFAVISNDTQHNALELTVEQVKYCSNNFRNIIVDMRNLSLSDRRAIVAASRVNKDTSYKVVCIHLTDTFATTEKRRKRMPYKTFEFLYHSLDAPKTKEFPDGLINITNGEVHPFLIDKLDGYIQWARSEIKTNKATFKVVVNDSESKDF